jgi:DNA adenine methylase
MNRPLSPAFSRSPLRYPGGKSRAARAIADLIPQTETRLCAPFMGGGSVELALCSRMEVSAFDIFPPLVDFWEEALEDPEHLAVTVRTYYPLDREDFYDLQRSFADLPTRLFRAATFFVLNRASYSGITLSGGMSPGHPRFTLSAIRRLETFRPDGKISVKLGDFRDVIPCHPNHFLYLDPPYWINQGLYGNRGDAHRGFDHQALYELLSKRDRWILSYNDSPQVRELYKDFPIESLSWVYGMGKNKKSREVIIFSKESKR